MELQEALAQEPYLGHLGLEIETVQEQGVALRLPLRREVINHLGMVHGGAQFGLGEATAIALAGRVFKDQLQQVNLLTANATITYRRPSRGGLIGRATLPTAEEQDRLRAIFVERGRARFPVAVELVDETGEVVTTLTVECVALASK
jgi:uncharacterized protein (TIGR00369 family)